MYILWENMKTRNQNTACVGKEKEPSWVLWVSRLLWYPGADRRSPSRPGMDLQCTAVWFVLKRAEEQTATSPLLLCFQYKGQIFFIFFSVEIRILAWFQSSLRFEMLDWKSHLKNLSEITLAKKSFSTLCMQVFCICVSLSAVYLTCKGRIQTQLWVQHHASSSLAVLWDSL